MAKFQKHVFVCANERSAEDPRGSCKARGAEAVLSAFKEQLVEAGFKRVIRPNKAGCLDQCAHGVCMVVYPDAVWYGGVTPGDVPEIIEKHLIRGEIVQRLLIPDDKLTGLDPARQGKPA